jgi:7-keto-8-aminopelargonate synthetase-like enzyme
MGGEILRVTLNARHTKADIDRCVTVLTAAGRKHGLLDRPS